MKKLILSFLRPYVLQIIRDHLKVTIVANKVTGVTISEANPQRTNSRTRL